MRTQLYYKKGRRYEPVGFSDGWFGFPSDGIWLVQTKPSVKSSQCILKLGELPELYPFAQMMVAADDLTDFIIEKQQGYAISASEFAKEILKFLTELSVQSDRTNKNNERSK